ncbi:hypothetical protein CDAR_84961 [Caerostris darwini]|uniref:Uncharacterized protein n=1 Tax=Caerostris darwini TaxID=1538125 RepID=A0AAV4N2A6_9ARAC|nr:hypothetical protein CDAR_84961 [Caerostris darwini]
MNLSVDAYWSLSGNIVHVEYGIPIEVDENKEIIPIVSEWNHTLEFSPEDTIRIQSLYTSMKQVSRINSQTVYDIAVTLKCLLRRRWPPVVPRPWTAPGVHK